MLDTARKKSIVYPPIYGFAKVFSYHLFTEKSYSIKKPTENFKQFRSRIPRELNPTFERL